MKHSGKGRNVDAESFPRQNKEDVLSSGRGKDSTSTCFTETPDGVILNVRAQPRSSRAGIDGVIGDAVKVRIRSAPVDGKANRELIETLADEFGLAKSQVEFKSGETSKTKRILLHGVTAAVVRARMREK